MNKFIPEGRTAVFIDGVNSYATTRQLGFTTDYQKLLKWLNDSFDPVMRVNYYTAVSEDETERQTIRPLIDWLGYNGYNVVTKKNRVYESGDRPKVKSGIDIELAVDIVLAAQHVHNIVVFSGDANLKKPIQVAQGMGCRVVIVSTVHTQVSSISDELRRIADEYIDYRDIQKLIEDTARRAPALVDA